MSSHSLHVTLEPFSSASQTGTTPTFLTPSGNLAPIHTGGSGSASCGSGGMSGSGLPHLQRESSLLKELGAVQWNTPLPSPTGGSSAMDTSGDGGSGSGAIKSEAGGSSSGSGGSKDGAKDGAKDSKEKDSHGPKDAKYLENFLSSISNMPEWVREKIGRIKGLERAMLGQFSSTRRTAGCARVSLAAPCCAATPAMRECTMMFALLQINCCCLFLGSLALLALPRWLCDVCRLPALTAVRSEIRCSQRGFAVSRIDDSRKADSAEKG